MFIEVTCVMEQHHSGIGEELPQSRDKPIDVAGAVLLTDHGLGQGVDDDQKWPPVMLRFNVGQGRFELGFALRIRKTAGDAGCLLYTSPSTRD